jgi:hypothetical protein
MTVHSRSGPDGTDARAGILSMGVGKLNHARRESVLRYTRGWQDYVTRRARGVVGFRNSTVISEPGRYG